MTYHHVSKVTSKGQVVIPKALRNAHGMLPGSKVILIPRNGEVRVRALDRDYFERFVGLLGTDGRALTELLRSRRDGERHVVSHRL